MLCCTALYCTVLYCTVLQLYCTVLCCAVLCCAMLCCAALLHCTALHCTALHFAVLYQHCRVIPGTAVVVLYYAGRQYNTDYILPSHDRILYVAWASTTAVSLFRMGGGQNCWYATDVIVFSEIILWHT